MDQRAANTTSSKPVPYRIWVLLGTFGLLTLLIIGAFVTKMPVKASMDGVTKLSFEIFEKSRDKVITDSDKPKDAAIASVLPKKLADRIQRSRLQLAGASILWVDDRGARQNIWERRALSSLGVAIDTATTTSEAISLLESGFPYDVIITDLARDNGDAPAPCYPGSTQYSNAGCAFIQAAAKLCGNDLAPVIIYAADLNEAAGQPAFSAGMTNRFDKLTDFVLDAVERRPRANAGAEPVQGICAHTPLTSAPETSAP